MRIVALIQARLGSKRFPRKVLAEINGKPMIWWVIQAVRRTRMLDDAYVCAPNNEWPIFKAFDHERVVCPADEPADENDVAGRFIADLQAMDEMPDAFVRICADSPLIHPDVVDLAVAAYRGDNEPMKQLVGFPTGQQVQVFNTEWFIEKYETMTPEQKEHPGLGLADYEPWVQERPRMVVDYPEDLPRIEAIMRKLGRPHWEVSWPELLQAAKECDEQVANAAAN